MKVTDVNINLIKPYNDNPRVNEDAIEVVQKSLQEFGFQQPLVLDKNYEIIVGHTRFNASKRLGLKEVPCVIAENLSEERIKAYRIMDNKSAEFASWNYGLLTKEMTDLLQADYDLDFTGFTDEELADLGLDFDLDEFAEEGLTDEDEAPALENEPVTKLGDVWVLGNHRIMCGDSASIDNIDKLMDKNKADLVFTDPPYNIDYQDLKGKHEKIKNDKMSDEDFVDFLTQTIHGCEQMYVCCSWQYVHLFKEAMIKIGRSPKAMIVWDKVNPAQHLDKYYKQHELILYYGDFGGHKTLRGDVWKIKRQRNELHPTMKPVELIDIALKDQEGKTKVADYFLGSGSTLIACEKNRRVCYGMELDPKYCDVTIKRWQNYTGSQAILESSNETFDELLELHKDTNNGE
jgi:DNA modification methylase